MCFVLLFGFEVELVVDVFEGVGLGGRLVKFDVFVVVVIGSWCIVISVFLFCCYDGWFYVV